MSTLAHNKRATFDYQVLEEFEAGLKLTGPEVKAAKLGHINMQGSFITILGNEAWLRKMHISAYQKATAQQINYSPEHDRKLLLKKKEISYLTGKSQEKGLTIIPVSVYTTRRLIKVKIALVKPKKKFDKRQAIKKRDIDREIARNLKNY